MMGRVHEIDSGYYDPPEEEAIPLDGYYDQPAEIANAVESAQMSLIAAAVASCTCGDNSLNAGLHEGHCRTLKIANALDQLDIIAAFFDTAGERAAALVHRFEHESMALHKTQREWLVREITAAIGTPEDSPDLDQREALFHTACKTYLAAYQETNDFPESMRAVIEALYKKSAPLGPNITTE